MKRLLCTFTFAVLLVAVAVADVDNPIAFEQLPPKAQVFVRSHYPLVKMALIKAEKEWWVNSYTVILTNGFKLEFDRKGNWTKVNCRHQAVPVDIVPQAIRAHVAKRFPGHSVVRIEVNAQMYDVFLSGGTRLKFNKKCQLIK